MRRLIIALVVLLAVYLILSRFTELQQVADTLGRGQFLWLLLALALQFTSLGNAALMYKYIYRLLGMPGRLTHLLPLSVTSNFINTVAPSGGVGGMAVFINDARRHGASTVRVTIAGVLYVLFDYFGFICVLAVGLAVLFRTHNLTGVELGATAILLLTALTLAGLLALGVSSPPNFERVLIGAARTINRLLWPFLRRPYLSEARAHEFAAEAALGLSALRTDWQHYLIPAGLSLLGKLWLIGILALTFLAFNEPFDAGTIVAGFSIGFLFTIVSPTPSGIGVVEGAMTVALTSLGVPIGAATVITLAYRGLTFWLPFVLGFIALRVLDAQWGKHRQRVPAAVAAASDERT
jgi:uncharacterized protein (TIRG00374 family)